jgi:tetraacyldisaccharide 4'-kinase
VRKLLAPASSLYGIAVRARLAAYSRGLLETCRLSQPVVCVGNLTVGGSGKTPLVAAIARILARRNFKPGILTRGYGRDGGERLVALPPGPARRPDARIVGDEPALLARMLPDVPIIVSPDRCRGGRFAEEKFGVNVHVLDDGFQHLALRRDVDIVAVDVTRPPFEEPLLPAGRLREPVSGLSRAHMVVLTRVGEDGSGLIVQRLQAINSGLQIFQNRTELLGLVDAATGATQCVENWRGKPVAAFCGIGNPDAFFADLGRWGVNVIARRNFPDHHRYHDRELVVLRSAARESGAVALITTEKDLMNLPLDWRPDVPVFACRIEARFEQAERFEQALLRLLEKKQGGDLNDRS